MAVFQSDAFDCVPKWSCYLAACWYLPKIALVGLNLQYLGAMRGVSVVPAPFYNLQYYKPWPHSNPNPVILRRPRPNPNPNTDPSHMAPPAAEPEPEPEPVSEQPGTYCLGNKMALEVFWNWIEQTACLWKTQGQNCTIDSEDFRHSWCFFCMFCPSMTLIFSWLPENYSINSAMSTQIMVHIWWCMMHPLKVWVTFHQQTV